MIASLEIGQGFFGVLARALELEEEDGQGAKQGEIACRRGVSDGAPVLVLGAVPPVVLAILDGPVASGQAQECGSICQVWPEAGEEENCFLMKGALAAIGPAVQSCGLSGEREIDLCSVEWAANQRPFFDASVALFNLRAFRGKRRSAGAGA